MMLGMYLAKKMIWERCSEDLIKIDHGYQGGRYDNRGERKCTLKKLISDLHNMRQFGAVDGRNEG